MGIVKQLPVVEQWLADSGSQWETLSDNAYKLLVRNWRMRYLSRILARTPTVTGVTAIEFVTCHAHLRLSLFSGVLVPEIANLGGWCASGFIVSGLSHIDFDLL